MFNNYQIKFISKIICLLTFISVIIFINNLYTLGLIAIFIFIFLKIINYRVVILIILNIIGFIIGYISNNLILLIVVLVITCCYYYLENDSLVSDDKNDIIYQKLYQKNQKKISKILKEGEVIDKEMIKEKTDNDYEIVKNNFIYSNHKSFSMNDLYYVLIHLSCLFISIIIGLPLGIGSQSILRF